MKLGRTTKIRQNFFYHHSPFSSFRTTKIRQNFLCLRLIHHSRYQCFISLWFNPSHLSLSLSVSAFVSILANRLPTAQPGLLLSTFVPAHYASSTSSSYSSFHLVSLLRHPVHDSHPSSFLALLGVPCIQCSRWV